MAKDPYQRESADQQREALILGHLSMVRHIVGRLLAKLPSGLDVENLEAAGVLGLVEAANRFDPTRGAKFETFAYTRIRGAVLDELRRNCPVPQAVLDRITKIREVHRMLEPPVSVELLAQRTGFSEADVNEALAAMRMTRMVSWENLNNPTDFQLSFIDDQPDRQVDTEERKRLVGDAIAQLSEQERAVVSMYYLEELRLKEIGRVMNLSESRISRILNQALFHMSEYVRSRQ